jgi:hypothetical protein
MDTVLPLELDCQVLMEPDKCGNPSDGASVVSINLFEAEGYGASTGAVESEGSESLNQVQRLLSSVEIGKIILQSMRRFYPLSVITGRVCS